jgi:hypothetical protein
LVRGELASGALTILDQTLDTLALDVAVYCRQENSKPVLLAIWELLETEPLDLGAGAMWQRGLAASAVYLAGLFAGAVLTPILLPWIPGAALAWKGGVIGLVTAILACGTLAGQLDPANSMALLLALPAVASYCAMNFTGSTTYTSPSGVEKEMRRAIPLQALAVLFAGVAWFWASFATSV